MPENLTLHSGRTSKIKLLTWENFVSGNILIRKHCTSFPYTFIHSTGTCRMRRFLAALRAFFHSCLLCTFSCHPSPPTILPSSFTSSCHLFLDLPVNLVVPKFIYNTFLGILFPSILCTCPNQRNLFNPLTPSDHYSGRTSPLTSKRCILYIHSTNIGTEYFKHGKYSPFFSLQNAVCFIILTHLVPVLFTFYIQVC